LCTP
jgi:hypothetical protein